jgi:hypothetical protein
VIPKDSDMKMHGTTTDPPLHDDANDERMLMAEYAIGYDGLRYAYNGYRYDRLADAVAYSKLMRSRPLRRDPGGPFTQREKLNAPTDADRELMTSLAIRFEEGIYRFEGFRYDRLADAVNYATLSARRRTRHDLQVKSKPASGASERPALRSTGASSGP